MQLPWSSSEDKVRYCPAYITILLANSYGAQILRSLFTLLLTLNTSNTPHISQDTTELEMFHPQTPLLEDLLLWLGEAKVGGLGCEI